MSDISDARPESALRHRDAPDDLAVGLREIVNRGMIDLRGLAGDAKFMAAAKDVLGLDLPTMPRTSVSSGDVQALWLSVDQWLILCPRKKSGATLATLRKAMDGIHSLAVDVSDMRAIIRLEGDGGRALLLKGSSLDLMSSDYKAGTVRRLRFAEIAALLHIVSEKPDVIDLYVFRSYADHAWDWLLATGGAKAAVRPFGRQPAPAV